MQAEHAWFMGWDHLKVNRLPRGGKPLPQGPEHRWTRQVQAQNPGELQTLEESRFPHLATLPSDPPCQFHQSPITPLPTPTEHPENPPWRRCVPRATLAHASSQSGFSKFCLTLKIKVSPLLLGPHLTKARWGVAGGWTVSEAWHKRRP